MLFPTQLVDALSLFAFVILDGLAHPWGTEEEWEVKSSQGYNEKVKN